MGYQKKFLRKKLFSAKCISKFGPLTVYFAMVNKYFYLFTTKVKNIGSGPEPEWRQHKGKKGTEAEIK